MTTAGRNRSPFTTFTGAPTTGLPAASTRRPSTAASGGRTMRRSVLPASAGSWANQPHTFQRWLTQPWPGAWTSKEARVSGGTFSNRKRPRASVVAANQSHCGRLSRIKAPARVGSRSWARTDAPSTGSPLTSTTVPPSGSGLWSVSSSVQSFLASQCDQPTARPGARAATKPVGQPAVSGRLKAKRPWASDVHLPINSRALPRTRSSVR